MEKEDIGDEDNEMEDSEEKSELKQKLFHQDIFSSEKLTNTSQCGKQKFVNTNAVFKSFNAGNNIYCPPEFI